MADQSLASQRVDDSSENIIGQMPEIANECQEENIRKDHGDSSFDADFAQAPQERDKSSRMQPLLRLMVLLVRQVRVPQLYLSMTVPASSDRQTVVALPRRATWVELTQVML